jgi:hypothetical protein
VRPAGQRIIDMARHIAIFSNNVSPGVGHITKAIAESAECARSGRAVLFATEETTQPLFDHGITFRHVQHAPRLEIRRHEEEPDLHFDSLLVTWSHWVPYTPEHLRCLREKWRRARRRVLLYDSAYGRTHQRLARQVRELRRYPWLAQADEICYISVLPPLDLFAVLRKTYCYTTGPNVDILFEPHLERELHRPYDTDARRPYFVLVSGALGTASRTAILSRLEEEAGQSDLVQIHRHDGAPARIDAAAKTIFWRAGGPGMAPVEFIRAMRACDFVLCLPGQFWTTRPYEALVSGCVPILDDTFLHSYDVDWQEGENCIIVKGSHDPESWVRAIRRASDMPAEQVLRMRRGIRQLTEDRLRPNRAAERLLRKLGLC